MENYKSFIYIVNLIPDECTIPNFMQNLNFITYLKQNLFTESSLFDGHITMYLCMYVHYKNIHGICIFYNHIASGTIIINIHSVF